MGEDNIALGRQSFLEDGMEKGEDTHLLKEQHTLPQLSRQEVPNCKSIASTNSGKPGSAICTHTGTYRKQTKSINLYCFCTWGAQ